MPLKTVILPFCILMALKAGSAVDACTIFYACDGKLCLGGNNEDWSDPDTYMWFKSAGPGEYGCVFFGFGNGFPQGGMNDQGLFFDGAATRSNPLKKTEGGKPFRSDLLDLIMRTCATVEEAVTLLKQYDIPFMERAMLFFGDRHGDSVIFEGDEILPKPDDARHQVVTNYYQSDQTAEEANCRRHQAAEKIFAERFAGDEPITLDLMKSVLDATHQEGKYATKYSNVYDLTKGVIHLYLNHDFDNAVTINLADELANGAHKVRLATLFESANRTIAWRWNTTCPISGKPVPRDREDCFFEHEGVRVYFCNPHCASDSAKDPKSWIARVYPDGPPAAIK